ncbi:MAP/microtubule affinity-regulating kinase 4 [Cricetulus griseus]|uniref:non-specific serine/threonine protein kinase n=1 Tax=Cricetulus griseus TaxID=10029 RepID=G3HIU6_CRIGR|nr:MAP/microtubule affinity-regulating kinase 4 [Cricetulus griseus]
MVMEYVAGQDLQMFFRDIDNLKEKEARVIFKQFVSAVHHLHQRHIAHRDIKLDNILIDNAGNIKLCDFEMATQVAEGQMLQENCGTLLYMAPEILAAKRYDAPAGDKWSMGILLYALVTGYFPYEETTAHALYRLITHTKFAVPCHLSIPCHTIIARLLLVPPRHSLTICEVLESSWLGHI